MICVCMLIMYDDQLLLIDELTVTHALNPRLRKPFLLPTFFGTFEKNSPIEG